MLSETLAYQQSQRFQRVSIPHRDSCYLKQYALSAILINVEPVSIPHRDSCYLKLPLEPDYATDTCFNPS